MPIRFAVVAILFAPISQATRAYTVFTDARVAASSVISPCPEPSLLETAQALGLVGMSAGEDESIRK